MDTSCWFHWFSVAFFFWVFPVIAISAARQLLSYALKRFLKFNLREYPWNNQLPIFNAVNEVIQSADYGISRTYYNLHWPFKVLSFLASIPITIFRKLFLEITFAYVYLLTYDEKDS